MERQPQDQIAEPDHARVAELELANRLLEEENRRIKDNYAYKCWRVVTRKFGRFNCFVT